ncbi:MAG: hypothetical protein DCF28_07075 [Alphaproteobacteria bacterium]|nr:MAG: hypothetical protein DCF28_07075 [Alphaproteobacteria bacterium]PZO38218.1 MAG: hypothetical protein DCE92_06370 [Alphaproteobacteria bacterium]
MLRILVPAVAALGLLTTAAQTQSETLDTAPAQEIGWHLSHDGEEAKLAYGVASSDQLALMIACAAGDADVTVYGDVRPVGMVDRANGTPFAPDPLSGGDATEASVPISAAGLGGLSRSGRMTVVADEGTFQLTATKEERRVIDRFLAYCTTGQA